MRTRAPAAGLLLLASCVPWATGTRRPSTGAPPPPPPPARAALPSVADLAAATRRVATPVLDGTWQGERYALRWPVDGGRLVTRFGVLDGREHTGIDLAAEQGAAVRAAAAGQVVYSGGRQGAYGNLVIVQHGVGYQTAYAHNRENLVQVGSRVRAGQVIARVGLTGGMRRPMLHFEVRERGEPRNPLFYLVASPGQEAR